MSTKDIDWGVQRCTTGHYYMVDAGRHFARPEYGPTAFSTDIRQKTFQFGKGKEFKTGKEALAAVEEFVDNIMNKASYISVYRMNFSNGVGEYRKYYPNAIFDTGWE